MRVVAPPIAAGTLFAAPTQAENPEKSRRVAEKFGNDAS
jgi:hypothetical protein